MTIVLDLDAKKVQRASKLASIDAKFFMKINSTPNEIGQFESRALQVLRSEKMRITDGRRAILRFLDNSRHAYSVKEIHDKLTDAGESVDLVTVYRTISVLTSKNLVHHIAAVDGYTACCLGDHEHSTGHTVCTTCGKVDEIEVSLEEFQQTIKSAESLGLKAGEVRLEITGICLECLSST